MKIAISSAEILPSSCPGTLSWMASEEGIQTRPVPAVRTIMLRHMVTIPGESAVPRNPMARKTNPTLDVSSKFGSLSCSLTNLRQIHRLFVRCLQTTNRLIDSL